MPVLIHGQRKPDLQLATRSDLRGLRDELRREMLSLHRPRATIADLGDLSGSGESRRYRGDNCQQNPQSNSRRPTGWFNEKFHHSTNQFQAQLSRDSGLRNLDSVMQISWSHFRFLVKRLPSSLSADVSQR